jgi:hypothetical protein
MFSIGDKVVCVDDYFDADTAATFSPLSVRGRIYCVGVCTDVVNGLPGVWVVGVKGIYYIGERERPLKAERFRRVWTAEAAGIERHADLACLNL